MSVNLNIDGIDELDAINELIRNAHEAYDMPDDANIIISFVNNVIVKISIYYNNKCSEHIISTYEVRSYNSLRELYMSIINNLWEELK